MFFDLRKISQRFVNISSEISAKIPPGWRGGLRIGQCGFFEQESIQTFRGNPTFWGRFMAAPPEMGLKTEDARTCCQAGKFPAMHEPCQLMSATRASCASRHGWVVERSRNGIATAVRRNCALTAHSPCRPTSNRRALPHAFLPRSQSG